MLHYMQIICFENTQYYLTQHSCSTPFEDLPIWKIQWKNLHVILLIFRSGETIFTLGRSLIHEFWKNYQILHFSLSKIWNYWVGDLVPRSAGPAYYISQWSILNKTHPFGPLSFLLEDLGRKLAPIITHIVAIDTVTAITTAAVLISLNDEIIFHLQDLIITVASPLFCSSKSVWKSSWWHIFKQSARKSICRVVYFRRIARIRRKIAPLFHRNN